MGKIFYVMGKSASGKDTIYKRLLEMFPQIKTVTLYTTRPIRDGEEDGVEYYFTVRDKLEDFRKTGRVIEERTYQTIYGPWSYFTVDDGQIDLKHSCYLMIGTLESYEKMQNYFGPDSLVPVYIYAEDGLRLERALEREKQQKEPKYKELCRRFLADEEDFKKENREKCGIVREYENRDLDECIHTIGEMIGTYL